MGTPLKNTRIDARSGQIEDVGRKKSYISATIDLARSELYFSLYFGRSDIPIYVPHCDFPITAQFSAMWVYFGVEYLFSV